MTIPESSTGSNRYDAIDVTTAENRSDAGVVHRVVQTGRDIFLTDAQALELGAELLVRSRASRGAVAIAVAEAEERRREGRD